MGYESQKTKFITYRNGTNGTNGTSAIGFYITASAYAFVKYQDGSLKEDKISLNAHRMNLTNNIKWFKKTLVNDIEDFYEIDPSRDGATITGGGEILEITQPGEYKATCGNEYEYEDFVTILEVQDGSSAISITLSNPSMVFSNILDEEDQACEVIVLEGADPLNYLNTEFTNLGASQFTIELTGEKIPEPTTTTEEDGSTRTSCIITISDKTEDGYKTLTVKGKNSAGVNFSQILTIYWTVVSGGLVLSLDNDSDVFVTKADGTPVSPEIVVTPILTRDGVEEKNKTFDLVSFPDSFGDGESLDRGYALFEENKLTISKIPEGFEHGIFTFEWGNLRTSFTLRAVQSNVDYNLWIDKTVINNTNTDENSGDKIKVRVQKIDANGTASFLTEDSVSEEGLTIEGGSGTNQWENDGISAYYSIGYSAGSEQNPIHVVLRGEVGNSSFTWDEETIDFVQNGQTVQDFNVTASAYAFVNPTAGSKITLTAHVKNIEYKDTEIKWTKENDSEFSEVGASIEVTYGTDGSGVGTYTAYIGTDWSDTVTIGKVSDGTPGDPGDPGEPAISIILTNPTMTFNANNETEVEYCEVVVYKGGQVVDPEYYDIDPSTGIEVTEGTNLITISHKSTAGSANFDVNINNDIDDNPLPSGFSQSMTINWTVVNDAESIKIITEPDVLDIESLPSSQKQVIVELYKITGTNQEKINSPADYYDVFFGYYNTNGGEISGTGGKATYEDSAFYIQSAPKPEAKPKTLQIQVQTKAQDGELAEIVAKATINILEAVSRRDHTIYHDAYSEASSEDVKSQFNSKTKLPILPDEKDYTKFPTHENKDDDVNYGGCRGWYTDQQEYIEDEYGNITGSAYLASKQNSYSDEEQRNKPWFGPREIKQTPLTYDYWYGKLDEEIGDDNSKGIYPLGNGVLGINASLIKTGALRIYPFHPDDPFTETETPVFETGWEATYDDENDIFIYDTYSPYVKIGGVNFTGLVPASTEQLSGPNLLISDENGIHLYNSNSITWAENKEYEGYKVTLTGPYKQTYVQEVFYRFMDPNSSKDTLYSLKAGSTYTLTGKAKISGGNQGDVLKFRSLVSDGSNWENYEFFDIVTRTDKQTEESDDANISILFKVPEDAKGFCFSFQLYDKNGDVVKNEGYVGTIILEDLRLLGNTLDVSGGYSWKFDQQKGLMMWSGPQGEGGISEDDLDPNLMFKIYKDEDDKGKLWLKGNGEFTGTIQADTGYIGGDNGWTIEKGHIGTGKNTTAFHLYSENQSQDTEVADNSTNDWRLIIGENFGVDSSGAVFATAGKIGSLDIENIQLGGYIGENLLEDSKKGTLVGAGTEYQRLQFKLTKSLSNYSPYHLSAKVLKYNQDESITVTLSDGALSDTKVFRIKTITSSNITYDTDGTGIINLTFEAPDQDLNQNQSTHLELYFGASGDLDPGNPAFSSIEWVKLESGTEATEWVPAEQSNQMNVDGPYSWKFSPSAGMYMWKGNQTADLTKAIFRIDSNGLYMNGNGTFSGEIVAKSGMIGQDGDYGGWYIDGNKMYSDANKGNGVGMSATNALSDPAFYAGFKPGSNPETGKLYESPWHEPDIIDWKDHTSFYVTNEGKVVCEDLDVRGGKIGGFDLQGNGFISEQLEITKDRALFRSARFVLDNCVEMGYVDEDKPDTLYINSLGQKDFIIKNNGGAGIQFLHDTEEQRVTVGLKLVGSHHRYNSGTTSRPVYRHKIQVTYTLSGTESGLFKAEPITIYWRSNAGTMRSQEIKIPKNSTYGSIEVYDGSSYIVNFTGISIDGTEPTSDTVETVVYQSHTNNNVLYSLGNFSPMVDAKADTNAGYHLGSTNKYWNTVFCYHVEELSDRNFKNTINNLDAKYSDLFDKLRPVTYKLNNGSSGRLHIGFIAQEVGEALNQSKIDSKDFAAYCQNKMGNGQEFSSLRYSEFIALCVDQIQKLKKRVAELESKFDKSPNLMYN